MSTKPKLATILSVLVVAAVTVPASAHAVHERRAQKRVEQELADLTASIEPVLAAKTNGRVTLNGATTRVKLTTVKAPLADVMATVEGDCKSGDFERALGGHFDGDHDTSPSDGRSRAIKLERIASQEALGGERASLCVFQPSQAAEAAGAKDDGHEPLRQVRYTLARQLEDGRTAVATVVNESTTSLADIFPAEGDAPGSDLAEVARPASARRVLTASVGEGADATAHTVRIYESTLSVESSVASYDAAMTGLGYATTGALPTARMYRRDGKSFVASFIGTTNGSNVTIAPFDGTTRTAPTTPDTSAASEPTLAH